MQKTSLIEQNNRFVVDLINAMARNEMSLLGDRTIGTEPNLAIELIADPAKKASVNEEGQARFIIGNIKFYCAGHEIVDNVEKSIAFYLMRFGNWNEQEAEGIYVGEEFKGVRFTYSPDFPPEEQKFVMIGELSSMISAAYSEQTVYEKSVIALDTRLEPNVFSVEIPEEYKGTVLPLWQFVIQPNPDFRFRD